MRGAVIRSKVEPTPYEALLERIGVAGRLVFRCAMPGCAADGAFGHGVALRKGQVGLWYCGPHNRGYLAAQAADAARASAASGAADAARAGIAGGHDLHGVPASPPPAALPARGKHGEGPRPRGGPAVDPRQSHLL